MAAAFKFDCYTSVTDGWVASGTVNGEAGGSFEERPVWYGCQAATWPELQAGMCKLAEVLKSRLTLYPKTTPIEAFIKLWPEDKPMLLPPVGNAEKLFAALMNVGSRRRGWLENADGVQIISFLQLGALAVLKPESDWKPELVSSFLCYSIGLVPEHPAPAPERIGQTAADLVEEILLGGRN